MKPGEVKSTRKTASPRWRVGLSLSHLTLILVMAGCAGDRNKVEKNLMADRDNRRSSGVGEKYLIGFPDVLEIDVAGHPEHSGRLAVGADGQVTAPSGMNLRVEGRTRDDIARAVAELVDVSPGQVQVRVAEYRSQYLYLMGQVVGWQRTIPYQGQETVLDVLQRVGGITPGAAPGDVYVVRSHLADSQRPEVFRVDLDDIVMKKDQGTNLRVMPFDQIHVGETRQARLMKCFPPWMQPLFHAACGSRPSTPDGKGVANRSEQRAAGDNPPFLRPRRLSRITNPSTAPDVPRPVVTSVPPPQPVDLAQ